jgi:adenylate kinase
MSYKVIYLTGAPASGKTTLTTILERVAQPLTVFRYGELLHNHVIRRSSGDLTHEQIRGSSDLLISPADVDAVDAELVKAVATRRTGTHIVIESHAMSREAYGFRATPFDAERLSHIAPDAIVCLYVDPEETCRRIAAKPYGRTQVSEFEALFHTMAQAAIASTYAVQLGRPVYYLDARVDPAVLVNWFVNRLGR